jgi:hypothetical protein
MRLERQPPRLCSGRMGGVPKAPLLKDWQPLAAGADNTHISGMSETPEQRKERLALQAIDGAKAAIEYREKQDAVRRRTAQLRAERLAREVTQRGTPKAKGKG